MKTELLMRKHSISNSFVKLNATFHMCDTLTSLVKKLKVHTYHYQN